MADTSYNFSFTGDSGSISNGVITIDTNNNVTGISGTVSGTTANTANGSINGLITENNFFNQNNKFYYPAPYFTNSDASPLSHGVVFYTGSFPSPAGGENSANAFHFYYASVSLGGYSFYSGDFSTFSVGSMSASPSIAAAVPEIDGALIPQVGLLIGSLFLILGRRKENTEPILAA